MPATPAADPENRDGHNSCASTIGKTQPSGRLEQLVTQAPGHTVCKPGLRLLGSHGHQRRCGPAPGRPSPQRVAEMTRHFLRHPAIQMFCFPSAWQGQAAAPAFSAGGPSVRDITGTRERGATPAPAGPELDILPTRAVPGGPPWGLSRHPRTQASRARATLAGACLSLLATLPWARHPGEPSDSYLRRAQAGLAGGPGTPGDWCFWDLATWNLSLRCHCSQATCPHPPTHTHT